jgi:RimJ/RimL family protein N-acetyltransferase
VDPILIHVPDTLVTSRLLLERHLPDTGKDLYAAAAASQSELAQYLDWAVDGIFLDQVESHVRRQSAQFTLRNELNYRILKRSDGSTIGVTGFVKCHWDIRQFEIGYWLATSETGNGYMTEACNALLETARTALQSTKLILRCDTRNVQSANIALRLGFELEGTHRRFRRDAHGAWTDIATYGLLT